jgi:hypothetical protein
VTDLPRHWSLDAVVDPGLAERCYASTPPSWWSGWEARYDNDCELNKRTTRRLDTLDPCWSELFDFLNGPLLDHFRRVVPLPDLTGDPTLHGAGVHVTDAGGRLQSHLDYQLHPTLGLERRLNVVVFLNPTWDDRHGGAFRFYDDSGSRVVKEVYPRFNTAVAWEPTDTAFHGTGRLAPDSPPRVTAACYYLHPPRPGACRKRALYVPNRGEA